MSDLLRFGVSIENELLENFDRMIAERGYANRSEALRDLIRDALVQSRLAEAPQPIKDVLGSLTLVYDHHARDLPERMAEVQHDHHEMVVSVLHVHISYDDCLEVIVLRGRMSKMRMVADSLLSLKGVKHGKLFVTVPAHNITERANSTHGHDHPRNKQPARRHI